MLLKSLGGFYCHLKNPETFILDIMAHWKLTKKNETAELGLNPEFSTYICELTYERDNDNHENRTLNVTDKVQFGDHRDLFEHIFTSYKIDRSNFQITQIFCLWLETYTRDFREKCVSEIASKVDDYIYETKVRFFKPEFSLATEMTDANLNNCIENIHIIIARQRKDYILAFKEEYLQRYLEKLEKERVRRRDEILEEKKENVHR